jgi:hypothetical protein
VHQCSLSSLSSPCSVLSLYLQASTVAALCVCALLLREARNSRRPVAERKAQRVFSKDPALPLPRCRPGYNPPPSLSHIYFFAPVYHTTLHFSWLPCELPSSTVLVSPSLLACFSLSVQLLVFLQCKEEASGGTVLDEIDCC